MLNCKIHRTECFGQPSIDGHVYRWSKNCYLSILDNPHVTSSFFYSNNRWICIISHISNSGSNNTLSQPLPLETGNLAEIYKQFSRLKSEGILVELVNEDDSSALRVISTQEGSIPVYFNYQNNVLQLSWDFKEITLSRSALTLDFEYLVKSSFEPIYSNRTAFQGISMLTAGSTIVLSATGCEYNYPNPHTTTGMRFTHISLNEAKEELSFLLHTKLTHQLAKSKKLAIELSGGLDSSTVAIATRGAFPDVAISTYGIIVNDPLLAGSQRTRRRSVIELIKSHDEAIEIKNFLPSLTSSSSERFYLNSEAYADAFEHIWNQAVAAGHKAILNGCGGDELFPHYVNENVSLDRLRSIDDTTWRSYKSLLNERLSAKTREVLESQFLSCAPATLVDTGMMLAMTRRAPLLLSLNLIPIYPLRDSNIIAFCAQLPLSLRLNKKLLENFANSALHSSCFSNYPKETFMHADEIALLQNRSSLLSKCKNFKIVEIGLIDFSILRGDLEHLDRKTPRYVYDYLLNILAIERFLEAYL